MSRQRRLDWLSEIRSSLTRRSSRQRGSNGQATQLRSLRSEPLEDRRLLAIMVDTLVDEADGSIVDGDVSLRDAIALATPGETINFAEAIHGGTILLTLGELAIDKSLTIDGPGAELMTVDASGNDPTPGEHNGDGSRVFNIDNDDALSNIEVELSGLTLTGGDVDGKGGGIYSFETLVVTATTVIGNAATNQGGGVWARSGPLGTTTIADTSVVGNHAGVFGGGIWASIGTTITGGQVIDNSAHRGGGIWADGSEINGTTIAQNSAANLGGGAWVRRSTLTGATIEQNHALSGGGGVVLYVDAAIIGSNVTNNTAGDPNTPAVALGAGVHIRQDGALIDNSTITGNKAYGTSSLGGGIWAGSTSVISNSQVAENYAAGGGGMALAPGLDQSITITRTRVTDNAADGYGGGIHSVTRQGSTVTITESIIAENEVSGPPASGGGVYSLTRSGGEFLMTDSLITGNFSRVDGAGVSLRTEGRGVATLRNNEIRQNEAWSWGGGLYASTRDGGDISILGNTISDNDAERGGGIAVRTGAQGSVEIVENVVVGNRADNRGGGLRLDVRDDSSVEIVNTTVADNEAPFGGGIWSRHSERSTTTIDSSTISGNLAENAAGIYARVYADAGLDIENSTISGNLAEGVGGGALVSGNASVSHSTIAFNRADAGGGWFHVEAAASFSHTVIAGNLANPSIQTPMISVDLTGLSGTTLSAQYSLIGDNRGTAFAEAPLGSPDANGNLIGDPDGQGVIDPQLGVLGDNGGKTQTHALTSESPAIDAGDPSFLPPPDSDQRGTPFVREFGDRIDMGAYERQSTPPLTLVVDTLVDERDGDYSAGDLSLREAIGLANGNIGPDMIRFDNSLAGGTILLTLGELLIDDDVVVDGSSLSSRLTVDASGNDPTPGEHNGDGSRVFHVNSGGDDINQITVSIAALTITGGDVADGRSSGGGIASREDITLDDITLVDNAARSGGGAHLVGTSSVINSQVLNNFAETRGGGLEMLTNSIVRGSTISGNVSAGRGGGIHLRAANLAVIEYSTISDNSALRGGGINDFFERTEIRHTTISGNYASDVGGGIYTNSDELILEHVTITDNQAAAPDSGGVFNHKSGSDRTRVYSSIIAGNANGDVGFVEGDVTNFESLGYNLVGTGNGAAAFDNHDQAGILDPQLSPLGDNGGPTATHVPLEGGPAIDAGDPSFVPLPAVDQRGYYRVVDGNGDMTPTIDIGAVEYASVAPLAGDGNLDGVVDGDDYLIWAAHFGEDPTLDPLGSPSNGDYNDDGIVDGTDYNVWAAGYGAGSTLAASNPAVQTLDDVASVQLQQELAAVDLALEDDYDTGGKAADDLAGRNWRTSSAFDSVLEKLSGRREHKRVRAAMLSRG